METQFHPLADLFPLLEGVEFAALAEDIRLHGLHEPITLHPDGRILDGRNRYLACLEADRDPRFTTWSGADGGELAFVISANLRRRHLNETQRAGVAARLANMRQGERTDLQPSANLPKVISQ